MTYSIVAFDRTTGRLGSAVASRSVAVGGSVVYSRNGVGLVNTQHRAHLGLGQAVLDRLEAGECPDDALHHVLSGDDSPDSRQFLALDLKKRMGVWTGEDCHTERGQRLRDECAAAGNMLKTSESLDAMIDAFENSQDLDFGLRLLLSLEASEALGGDRRGTHSAAIKVIPPPSSEISINLDIRVDDHETPLVELRRLYDLFRREFRE